MSSRDWDFCKESLQRHSRTFAIPIGMLPPRLERAITCSYLLCRIADTVEDTADWSVVEKAQLFRVFQDVLDGRAEPQSFAVAVAQLSGGDPEERELLLGLARVLAVFGTLPATLREVCREGVSELIAGMMVYSRRRPAPDGVRCLSSEADLERYCYFVAGVIGGLLTEAFIAELPELSPTSIQVMRAEAERFGAGLQMVNILRDLSADWQRGVCFVPRTLLDAAGLTAADLFDPAKERQVRDLLEGLFDRARQHLDAALTYTLAIPASAVAVRRFCAVPLWMAVATLELCRVDGRLLQQDTRVKLSRGRVMRLINECLAVCGDDARMRESYALLDAAPVEAA